MKARSLACALVLLPTTALLSACASDPQRIPVAVNCAEMAPVSAWMMAPSANAFLTKPLSKTPQKTPQSLEPGSSIAE